jgi:alcohol dehydrogenase, propanol-preferring
VVPARKGPSTLNSGPVFELHAAGKTHVIYERRRLEEVNPAIHEVETGHVKARLVFDLQ